MTTVIDACPRCGSDLRMTAEDEGWCINHGTIYVLPSLPFVRGRMADKVYKQRAHPDVRARRGGRAGDVLDALRSIEGDATSSLLSKMTGYDTKGVTDALRTLHEAGQVQWMGKQARPSENPQGGTRQMNIWRAT